MSLQALISFLFVFVFFGFAVIVYLLSKRGGQADAKAMRSLVDEVFGLTNERVTAQSKQVLEGQREIIQTDLQNKESQLNDLI